MIKSPLRYPGGKSRAIQKIKHLLPERFREYREPFVGGSFFIYLRQVYPGIKIWINDLNPELYSFWKCVQKDSEKSANEIFKIKSAKPNGQKLMNW